MPEMHASLHEFPDVRDSWDRHNKLLLLPESGRLASGSFGGRDLLRRRQERQPIPESINKYKNELNERAPIGYT